MSNSPKAKALVTGGQGFIGSHVARWLANRSYPVRVTDIRSSSHFDDNETTGSQLDIEFVQGDLLDSRFCMKVVTGIDIILHFAANMGGMGVIHEGNGPIIYKENHTMTLNLLAAAKQAGVQKILYASSACVYPVSVQTFGNLDVSLRESDVWMELPPNPQDLYGLEKLHGETVLLRGAGAMQVYIARFHNVYGPRGTFKDGREKAPAAFLRKVLASKLLGLDRFPFEMWGDGSQRRSFCFIDDAAQGIMQLLESNVHVPVNIGSDRSVSMLELAAIAAKAVGVDPSCLDFHSVGGPTGVGSRNSNNSFAEQHLRWSPSTPLEEGMRKTGKWIEQQMVSALATLPESRIRTETLNRWQTSQLIHLTKSAITFAILLPITSRTNATTSSADCLASLATFARSLKASMEDLHTTEENFAFHVYLAIDHDDDILQVAGHPAEAVLNAEGICNVVTLTCRLPRGHVCSLWRCAARKAWEDGCDYFVLMGDDVILPPEARGWMRIAHATFAKMSTEQDVPAGFGCVAFTDTTFPGMPTFPIVHRTHLDIFNGQVVPDVFVNQDGDPYLFQLYRRFGCATMMDSQIINTLGGSGDARYEKQHAKDWTLGTLDEATLCLETFLGPQAAKTRKLTVDVIIPCYRVNMEYLKRILALDSSPTCSIMFIVIIDNPSSPYISELEKTYGHRCSIRIRVNEKNLGASASRNRGLRESAAEYVLFLDDDVIPKCNILHQLEQSIHEKPNAAGFVGNAQFPVADTVFTTAVHLAGVTYFWDIAEKMRGDGDVPWGVTANLAARRNVKDNVVFDLSYPKTGGGEDIDFCRAKRQYSISRGGGGFAAAPNVAVIHPYWNNGHRSYWRFYMWSKGDGALIRRYPSLVYVDFAPNSAELCLFCTLLALVLPLARTAGLSLPSPVFWLQLLVLVALSNIVHDAHRHLWRNTGKDQALSINTTVSGFRWGIAVLESTFIRMFSELGRLVGMLERGEVYLLGRRFDWFAGHSSYGYGPRREERRNSLERFCILVGMASVMSYYAKLDSTV